MRWYESLSAATAVSKFGFDCHADLLLCARALCGENYSADELRAARARVRAATYPSEILTATSSSAAFDWLNGQCGGGHLPTSGPHYDWIMRRLDWVRDALGDGDY